LKPFLKLGGAVAAVDQMGVAVDEPGGEQAPAPGNAFARIDLGQGGKLSDPGDVGAVDGDGAALDKSIAPAHHGGDADVMED
jgi:hypothetical protein